MNAGRNIAGMLAVALTCAATAFAGPPAKDIKVYELTVHPAAAPVPALKHALMPTVLEKTPGNAMPLYSMAMAMVAEKDLEAIHEKVDKWLSETPPESLPVDEIRDALPQRVFVQVKLAASREQCQWDLPIREQGYSMFLPQLGLYRRTARMLALRARVAIVQGRHDDAIADLKTGFAMARHVAAGPTLINDLVAVAVADIMLIPVNEWVQRPDAPNLYWALTMLPCPMVDILDGLEYEAQTPYVLIPSMAELRRGEKTLAQYEQAITEMVGLTGWGGDERRNKLVSVGLALKMYPEAKKYLRSQGFTQEQVQAMSVPQAVMIHMMANFEYLRDEMFKWFYVPYWQAHEGFRAAEAMLQREKTAGRGFPATALLPSLSRASLMVTRLDRRIAALRCVEAIRLYAAAHEGKLPASLDDITEVPIPTSPVTGQPFGYSVEGNTATLEAPAMEGQEARFFDRYEITIQQTAEVQE